jgi:hypothetical protein
VDFFADGTINVDGFASRREAAEENEDPFVEALVAELRDVRQ